MKKSLVALAVASAVSAPAFAATSNVDVYGQFQMSVDFMNRDQAGVSNKFMLTSHNSRVGFKGAEDLGGGLSAIWQVETRLDADVGDFNAGARNTFVGVKSDTFGTVKLGYYDTAYKRSTAEYDVFSENWGDYNTLVGTVSGTKEKFNVREKNSINYSSPSFGGVSFDLSYGQRNECGNGSTAATCAPAVVGADPQLMSAAVSYAAGPLSVTGAYELHKDEGGANLDNDAWKLGAGFKFGNTKIAGIYERISQDMVAPASFERSLWYVSGEQKLGAFAVKAAFAKAGESSSGANDGATHWALGGDYNLSKRTKLYAEYNSLSNDVNAAYILGVSNSGPARINSAAGTDPHGFSLGIKHKF